MNSRLEILRCITTVKKEKKMLKLDFFACEFLNTVVHYIMYVGR